MNVTKWILENFPESVLSLLRPIYQMIKRFQILIEGTLDSFRVIGPDFIYNENYYSKRRNDPWRSDAWNVGMVINKSFTPDSVIDFGCAIGAHLEPFYESGVDIKGIEGNSKAFEYAVVPQEYLEQYDLRDRYYPEKTYDLALSFELAEHLPEQYADNLVDTLVESGDVVIMTAATPGQGGTHHVNEQPREYWYEKFESRGYEYDSMAVSDLREMIEVEQSSWVPDNLMVFYRSTNCSSGEK